jgi:hypothetical protein
MVIVMSGIQGEANEFEGVFPDLEAATETITSLEDHGSFVKVFNVDEEPIYDTEG